MNDNLFAFEVKPYGHHASHDTCMLYKQGIVQKNKEDKKKSSHVSDIIMTGLFLIGITLALTSSTNTIIVAENTKTEMTQGENMLNDLSN